MPENFSLLAADLEAAADFIDRLASSGTVPSADPQTADFMGAFEESALSFEDADEARFTDDGEELGDE